MVAAGAEYLVMGHLIRRNILSYKVPPGNDSSTGAQVPEFFALPTIFARKRHHAHGSWPKVRLRS